MRRVLRGIGVLIVTGLLVPPVAAGTVLGVLLFAPVPATLPDAKPGIESQISHVYDAEGEEIAIFREFETSVPVRRADIPTVLKQAVIASEDRSFYRHSGVDLRGTARAFWSDVRGRGYVQGGSTITQQYVKNAYTGGKRSIVRKVREAVLASQLDRQVEKEEILFRYLSAIYLGNGAYGVGAASETYFRKPVRDLSLSEAALLAGLIPAPSRYEPRGAPETAEAKRQIILRNMLRQGYITQQQHDETLAQRVWLTTQGKPKGPATLVHPPVQRHSKYPFFVDYVQRYLENRYGQETVFRGGLKIQTTLDPKLQLAAEESVAKSLGNTKRPLEMSLVAVEPPTGFVKALVGGRDFAASQVNLALGGCPVEPKPSEVPVEVRATCWEQPKATVQGGGSGRQSGSAFKPFTLAAALAQGVPPTKVYPAPAVFRVPGCRGPKGCTIGNNEGGGGGSATLRTATAKSINTVFAQLIRDVGVDKTAEMAKKLGLTSVWYSPRVHGLSYTLGPLDVSPLDMAAAYGVFAARGMRAEPTPVLKVLDAKGKVLEDNTNADAKRVLEEVVADNVNDLLRGVIKGGTARRADIGRPAAGKTGTSQNYTNAWFVGYTPTLSTAVWMGYSKNQKTPLIGINGVSRVFGGTIPAATWKAFMSVALKGVPVTDFTEAAPIRPIAEDLRRQARGGIDPGRRRYATPTGEPEAYEGPGVPRATVPPPTTAPPTTSAPPDSTTTSTPPTTLFPGPPTGTGDTP